MAETVPDRANDPARKAEEPMKFIAKCGHEDPLGHLMGTSCGKCARANHKKAMGR